MALAQGWVLVSTRGHSYGDGDEDVDGFVYVPAANAAAQPIVRECPSDEEVGDQSLDINDTHELGLSLGTLPRSIRPPRSCKTRISSRLTKHCKNGL